MKNFLKKLDPTSEKNAGKNINDKSPGKVLSIFSL